METAEDRALDYARQLARLRQLLFEVRDELHHKHGPDDGDTCFACFLEWEIDKALGNDGVTDDEV